MVSILALRPFIPARDFDMSLRFYEALGFRQTHADDSITILKQGDFSFILQRFYNQEWAENTMMQMLVRDVASWWQEFDAVSLTAKFGVKPPRAPALQGWGMVVGFVFDPSGVLWHIAEATF